MAVILLPAAFVLLSLLAFQKIRETRLALLAGWTIGHAILVTMTEVLSAFRELTAPMVLLCWGGVVLAASVWLLVLQLRGRLVLPVIRRVQLTRAEQVTLGVAAFLAFGAFVSGSLSPPNNWDSMTYKLPRITYWIQHRSVLAFPTHITRQIELNPGAGYTLLHYQLLSGTFHLFFFGQWISAIGAGIAASLIARSMGGDRRSQIFAAVSLGTIPMLVLQASSTQDDLTAGAWVMVFVAFGFELLKNRRRPSLMWAALTGAALGVALIIKGTSYFFAFPFCLAIAIAGFANYNKRWLAAFAVIGCLTVALPIPFLARNNAVFGNPYGGPQRYMITNQQHGPQVLVANTVRNLAVNFVLPATAWNEFLERKTRHWLHKLGIDPEDWDMIFPYAHYDLINRFDRPSWFWHEDWAPNPLSTIFVLLACAIAIFRKRRDRGFYSLCVLGGILFFMYILRYQPWITRLQLPFFMLGMPLLILVLDRWRRVQRTVLLFLLATSIPAMLFNDVRPILGARSVFLHDSDTELFEGHYLQRDRQLVYLRLAQRIHERGARRVGIVEDKEAWEWPLHYYFMSRGWPMPWFGHFHVDTAAGHLEQNPPWRDMQYDALVFINHYEDFLPPDVLSHYEREFYDKNIQLWFRKGVE